MDKPPANFNIMLSRFLKAMAFAVAGLLCSCQMVTPEIAYCDSKVVYDFSDSKTLPKQKLSFFIQLKSEVRRVAAIKLIHNQSGFTWVIDNPIIIKKGNNAWAGYTDFMPVPENGRSLPSGKYSVVCVHADGEEAVVDYELYYDEKYVLFKLEDLVKEIEEQKNFKKTIGVYENSGALIYYGDIKDNWTTGDLTQISDFDYLWNMYKDSAFVRIFYTKDKITCIMPAIYKVTQEQQSDKEENKSNE